MDELRAQRFRLIPGGPKEVGWPEPEMAIVVIAWLLALAQIGIGVVRGEAFGPDRSVALVFVIGCLLVSRPSVRELTKRLAIRSRHR